jgi:hypothetical protein
VKDGIALDHRPPVLTVWVNPVDQDLAGGGRGVHIMFSIVVFHIGWLIDTNLLWMSSEKSSIIKVLPETVIENTGALT